MTSPYPGTRERFASCSRFLHTLGFVLFFSVLSTARAEVGVTVTFKSLVPEFERSEPAIRAHVIAAAQEWIRHLETADCTIEVEFSIRDWPTRGAGRSFVSAPYRGERHEGKYLSAEGAAHELRTGEDPNGSEPDIELFFDPVYFRKLWFDPEPGTRRASMPRRSRHKLDAFSVILHELGHAFGFNGFRDPKTGSLPGKHMSIYDRWVISDGDEFYFDGPAAKKIHGGPVLLARTNNNYHHVGEKGDRRSPELAGDLMNGVSLKWSHRYHVSPLDIAILNDCGLTAHDQP